MGYYGGCYRPGYWPWYGYGPWYGPWYGYGPGYGPWGPWGPWYGYRSRPGHSPNQPSR